MKKVIIISMYIITSVVMISCTNDSPVASQNKTATTANTQLADGQGDPIPIPPPKP